MGNPLLGLIRVPLGKVVHAPVPFKGSYHSDPGQIKSREEHIKDLKTNSYDVVIIGAGATGAGLAVECSTRGLTAAIVDANDFAAGTSSKSTKLIHGGIRYLEAAFKTLDFHQLKLVFEGLRERSHMRQAGGDMLTKPVGMFIPQKNILDAFVTSFGCRMYELIAKVSTPGGTVMIPDSKMMNRGMAAHLVTAASKWKRSLLFFDGAHIDQRTVMHLINTATQPGYVRGSVPSSAANYTAVTGLNKGKDGEITSANVKDLISGDEFQIDGKVFINCTGPFSDSVRHMGGKEDKYIKSASGIHLMFPKRVLNEHGGNAGILIPKTSRGSVCFVLPYQDYVVAGTTDVKEPASMIPLTTEEEVKYLCAEIGASCGMSPDELEKSVISCWKGFRPLVVPPSKGAGNVSKVVRSHLLTKEGANFYSLMGGKWTSYREMAHESMDLILNTRRGMFGRKKPSDLKVDTPAGRSLVANAKPSVTYALKWAPATPTEKFRHTHFDAQQDDPIGGFAGLIGRQFEVDPSTANRLCRYYGFYAWDLLYQGKVNQTNRPLSHIPLESRILESEVEWVCEKEQARHLSDTISRRLGLSFLDARAATAAIPEVALVMKRALKWSGRTTAAEIRECANEVSTFAYHPIEELDALRK